MSSGVVMLVLKSQNLDSITPLALPYDEIAMLL